MPQLPVGPGRFSDHIGKTILVILDGAGGPCPPGVIVSVDNNVLVISNRFSSRYNICMGAIACWWFEDDKPED